MDLENIKIRWQYSRIKKGAIYCLIQLPDYSEHFGLAETNPKDHFCKDTGRKLSLSRAMANAKLPKEERVKVWEAYRTSTKKPRW